jgi:hypothetical protein
MPPVDVGAEVRRNRALNCWPWVRSFDPFPRRRDPLAGGNGRGVTNHGYESARLGAENAEAVFFVVEGDALDEACQRFLGRRCLGWLHAILGLRRRPRGAWAGWRDYVAVISSLIRWTVPVPSPSILATLSMPTPFSSCFLALRSRAMSTLGRPSRVP